MLELSVRLPRYAFSPRNAARAGDIWRAFQEVATDASTACGWSPGRYHELGIGFIVREMTTVHLRETAHGEPIRAQTWTKDFRRGMVTTRELRLEGPLGPLAAASQEWVHVRANPERKNPDEPMLKPARASEEMLASFIPEAHDSVVVLPAYEPLSGPVHEFSFEAWMTWMDPLGHANHPVYVDWCDEATSRAMTAAGLNPVALRPVAERVYFKAGVMAGDHVRIATKIVGRTAEGDAVLDHQLFRGDQLVANALTMRRLVDGSGDALLAALG